MIPVVICDVDGTVAESKERAKAFLSGKKDWEKFYEAAINDEPVMAVVATVKALMSKGYPVIYITGRPEKYRGQTSMWLMKHGLEHVDLLMRSDGDFREDCVVKREHYIRLLSRGVKVLCVFEDRDQVVDMWRGMNVPCFQVRKGDY